ncbi:hypothetical protein [Parabacteroides goldsteinii]|jgi:hypothetical protein|uniref:hypothetical protein n=1 Tax=Parabacteroides goldsteinii TaxID=328812 RepID=UPI002672DA3D|nr:hypothetical protein [Parabacteroides goldsteinii]
MRIKNYLFATLATLLFFTGNIFAQETQKKLNVEIKPIQSEALVNSYVYPKVTLTYAVFDDHIDVYGALSSTEGVTSVEWWASGTGGNYTFSKWPSGLSIITLPIGTYRVSCSPVPGGSPAYYMIWVYPDGHYDETNK